MVNETSENEGVVLTPWEPERVLRQVTSDEVRYSRGFLRSKPEKLFPALTAHWLPLAHSLGVELQVTEVRPLLGISGTPEVQFAGTVDGQPVALLCDLATKGVVLSAIAPTVISGAGEVVFEYMARRLLASLGDSWSGAEASMVLFDAEAQPLLNDLGGYVRIAGKINNNQFQCWVALSRALIDRLDGLWRRQWQSTSKGNDAGGVLRFEIAQLAVPPTMLGDYLRAGTVIDLEVPSSDGVVVRLGQKVWASGRMLAGVNNSLAIEMNGPSLQTPVLPEGTTRLAIEVGSQQVDAASISELNQVGAILGTSIALSDAVQLVINGEVVGNAQLCSYQGRFAMTVG
jgi:flagellar motor switch/type III secretory pathway protein FliN